MSIPGESEVATGPQRLLHVQNQHINGNALPNWCCLSRACTWKLISPARRVHRKRTSDGQALATERGASTSLYLCRQCVHSHLCRRRHAVCCLKQMEICYARAHAQNEIYGLLALLEECKRNFWVLISRFVSPTQRFSPRFATCFDAQEPRSSEPGTRVSSPIVCLTAFFTSCHGLAKNIFTSPAASAMYCSKDVVVENIDGFQGPMDGSKHALTFKQ